MNEEDDNDDDGDPASLGCYGYQMSAEAHGQLNGRPADQLCQESH